MFKEIIIAEIGMGDPLCFAFLQIYEKNIKWME